MKIIFDFDHTLFSAKRLVRCLKEEFKKVGVNEKLFSETFQKSKTKGRYTPEKHFRLIIEKRPEYNLKMLRGIFKKVINKADMFLYPDVLPVLKDLKKENELILLSYGYKEFQMEKIENSKITKYFSKIIITQEINKISTFKKILKEMERGVFVEDNPKSLTEAKKSFPNIITVRINRNEGLYTREPNSKEIDFIIKNLKGFRKILER